MDELLMLSGRILERVRMVLENRFGLVLNDVGSSLHQPVTRFYSEEAGELVKLGITIVEDVGSVDNSPPERVPHEEYVGKDLAKAYKKGEFAETFFVGEKYETQDVKCDIEIRAGAEYSKKFFEDASWPVLERQTAEVGRAVADLETKTIYDYLVANAGTSTTGDGGRCF